MKFKTFLVLVLTLLLNLVATVSTSQSLVFAQNQPETSIQKSGEAFWDPQLQETLSAPTGENSERLIVVFDSTKDIAKRIQALLSLNGIEITQVFRIIPAVAANVPLNSIENIGKLEGVKAVWLDRKVQALSSSDQTIAYGRDVSPMLSESTQLINAPSLWDIGFNGSGKIIAVVDTGINWYHESLDDLDDNPATIDPKVIGNVSFVEGYSNGSSSGFDDHGHGTHVAGIAAGTGGPSHVYMGVAPGARLYAVKVLTSGGWGMWSWVVSGIEWSVEHHADIITMSLGGGGHPFDPVSMASDAAVDAGIIVTVAAGNSGYYGTVSSPGLAKKVITVGASTKGDGLALFSSGGPNPGDYRGDPDVVAPGVGIMSADAFDLDGYVAYSGTSMATPHVAGAAALLLQAFAGITPAQVQTSLMVSAVDIGYDSYRQGAGRIDVLGAYNAITEAISMGFLSNQNMFLSTIPAAAKQEVSPKYAWFSNSRIQFWVDDFGNIPGIYFDSAWSVAVIAWRIAYNSSNYASWVDLDVIKPMSNTVTNPNYQQAVGAFRTPDRAAAIFVMIELFGNETWARTSFKVWPMHTTLENLRIFAVEDSAMNSDFGYDWAYYYAPQDVVVVNDTRDGGIIIKDTNETTPGRHFGFGGVPPPNSSAHHVGPYPDAFYAAYYDELNNMTDYIGDDNNAFRWSLGNVDTPVVVPYIFGFAYNVSATFDVIDAGRAKPPASFDIIPYPELSVSLTGPTLIKSATLATYTATVMNYWIGNSTSAVLTFYVDGVSVGYTVIDVPSGASVQVSKSVLMNKGLHTVKAKIDDVMDPLQGNNAAKKKVFADIMFSAVLPNEVEVNTYSNYGPFANSWLAWVNLTILTPIKMPEVEIKLTGDLSQVVSFVDSPKMGDVEDWAYLAFEIYASGQPYQDYNGFIQILSMGNIVNEVSVKVNVPYNPVPKINSVSLNDTNVFRVAEALEAAINVTDTNQAGLPVAPSNISVNIYLLYFDSNYGAWFIIEGPISATYDPTTGLHKFTRTFTKTSLTGRFGIGVEALDNEYGLPVRAMARPFYVANNIPVVNVTLTPRTVNKSGIVQVNVTASDVETPVESLLVTASISTPTGRTVQLALTRVKQEFTTTFSDTDEEGMYVLVVLVTDSDKGFIASAQTFNVDSTKPAIGITSPADGAVVSGTVEVTFTVWDENLKNATVTVDEGSPNDVTEATSFTLNTATLTDGTHTIKLVAHDDAENTAEDSITIKVDNTAPSATLTSPADESSVQGTVSVGFTLTDANLDKATLLLDGKTMEDVTGETSCDWNTVEVADGAHLLTLKAVDKAGNIIEETHVVFVDNTKPKLNVISPESGSEVAGTLEVHFSALDVNLLRTTYAVDGGTQVDITDETNFTINTADLTEGTHAVTLTATDKAGNSATQTLTITVDNTKPTVGITSPPGETEIIGPVSIEFTVSDTNLEKVILYIDNATFDVTGRTSYDWDTTKVGDGTHTIRVMATDSVGNTKYAEVSVTTKNVQKATDESFASGRNLGLVVAAVIGIALSVPLVYIIIRRPPKKP